MEWPVLLSKMLNDGIHAGPGTDHFFRPELPHYSGETSGMIHLRVVEDQIVQVSRGKDFPRPGQKFIGFGGLNAIHECLLFVHDQESVVGASPFSGVSVKIPEFPIYCPDPKDILLYLKSIHFFTSPAIKTSFNVKVGAFLGDFPFLTS